MDRGAWWATVHGVAKSRTRLSDFTHTHIYDTYILDMCVYTHTDAYTYTSTQVFLFQTLKARGKFNVRLIELRLQDSSVMGPP